MCLHFCIKKRKYILRSRSLAMVSSYIPNESITQLVDICMLVVICYLPVVSKYEGNFGLWITLHFLNYLHNYGYPAWTRDGTGRCQLFLSLWSQWIQLKTDLQERELHYLNELQLSSLKWFDTVSSTPNYCQACHLMSRSICPGRLSGSGWIWPHCKSMFHINSWKATRSALESSLYLHAVLLVGSLEMCSPWNSAPELFTCSRVP